MAGLEHADSAKYKADYTGDKGTSRTWQIREDGFDNTGPGIVDLTPAIRSHFVTNWIPSGDDEYSPILGSETKATFYDTAGLAVIGDLFQDLSDTDRSYSLVLLEGSTVKWQGFIDPDQLDYREDGARPPLTVVAQDGLGRLEDSDYMPSGALPSGMSRVKDVIVEILDDIPWQMDITLASNMFPWVDGTELLATEDPIHHAWLDKSLFTFNTGKQEFYEVTFAEETRGGGTRSERTETRVRDAYSPVSRIDALRTILERYGMVVFQADGGWHMTQVSLRDQTSYRRWRYDYTGVFQATDVFSPGITPSDEDVQREVGTISTLKPYSATAITYAHGRINVLENTGFTDPGYGLRGGRNRPYVEDPWVSGNAANSKRLGGQSDEDFKWFISQRSYDWVGQTAAQINTKIDDYWVQQVARSTFVAGFAVALHMEAWVTPAEDGNTNPVYGQPTNGIPVQIKHVGDSNTYYAVLDTSSNAAFTWSMDAGDVNNWMVFAARGAGTWHAFEVLGEALPEDGTIEIKLGCVFGDFDYTLFDATDGIHYDNVSLDALLPDDTFNGEATTTVNYISREHPRIRNTAVMIGDGPTTGNQGALHNDENRLNPTTKWKEGVITAGEPNETMDELLSIMQLRSMNNLRELQETTYWELTKVLTPLDVILRSGGGERWAAYEIAADWQREMNSGRWYHVREVGFSNDFEYGTDFGTGGSSWLNRGSDASARLLNQLKQVWTSSTSLRVAITTESIPAGSGTADVDVEAILEPLLNDDDIIILLADDLSFYQLSMTADQSAGATNLAFDDPDNPGSNYNFPKAIPIGANIFFVNEKQLSLVRQNEAGFAVSVLGQPAGKADGAQSGTLTSLTVKEWQVAIPNGDSVYLADDTELVLTAEAARGATSIAFTSTVVDAADDEFIYPEGQFGNRAEFIIMNDSITSNVNRLDQAQLRIGELRVSHTGVITEVDMAASPFEAGTADIVEGDRIYIVSDDDFKTAAISSILTVDEDGLEIKSTPSRRTIAVLSQDVSGTYAAGSGVYTDLKQLRLGQVKVTAAQVSLNVTDISTNTTTGSTNATNISTNTGNITVESDRITAMLSRSGDRLGLLDVTPVVGLTLKCKANIGAPGVTDNDIIFIHDVSTGEVYKAIVNGTQSGSQPDILVDSITFSPAWTPAEDDVVYRGHMSGLNLEFGLITVHQSTIQSDVFTAGVEGWKIEGDGTAEFGDGIFRGILNVGSSGMKLGDDASGAGDDGIYINADNYWYDTGVFRLGNATNGIRYLGSGNVLIGNDVDIDGNPVISGDPTITGTLSNAAGDYTIGPNGITYQVETSSSAPTSIIWEGAGADDAMVTVHDIDGITLTMGINVSQVTSGDTPSLSMNVEGPSSVSSWIEIRPASILLTGAGSGGGDVHVAKNLEIDGALNHDGTTAGFYATAPITQQTGVAVTAAGIHAACVALGLFTA